MTDAIVIERLPRGLYIVHYNGLRSRPIPSWRVEFYKRRAVNVYHRRWGRGR